MGAHHLVNKTEVRGLVPVIALFRSHINKEIIIIQVQVLVIKCNRKGASSHRHLCASFRKEVG